MKKISIAIVYLTAAGIVLCSCNLVAPKKTKTIARTNPTPVVEGFIVQPSTMVQTISVSGTLKPFEETVLMPDISGRVVALNLPEGKQVSAGILLAKLFNDDLQAGLKKLEAQLHLAELTEKRQKELLNRNNISQEDYDQAALQIEVINSDIEMQKAQIRKTEVHAPYDGTIGLRNVSLGAQVTPLTALATIRSVSKLKLDFSVPEKYAESIKPGLRVAFSVNGEDERREAAVTATEEAIEMSTRNLKVRALVADHAASLKPGFFADVSVQLGENKSALMVPTQAIIPQERNKQVIVARGNKAVFINVKTGVRQASSIEIEEGLVAGDTIVTTGILFLKPGADLKFSKIAQQQ